MSNTGNTHSRSRLRAVHISLGILLLALSAPAWGGGQQESAEQSTDVEAGDAEVPSERGGSRERGRVEIPEGHERVVLAGGCFWCMEPPFDEVDGVHAITTGFAGGDVENPTYRQAVSGGTGHQEVVEVIYDPQQLSFREIMDVFWMNVDPVDSGGQFCDRGSVYETGIFYETGEQREVAVETRDAIDEAGVLDSAIVTEIRELDTFYPAEEEHQAYYRKNPTRYRFYVQSCGRENRLEQLWGELVDEDNGSLLDNL
ncbi:MAG: peptide-methionine (S)-S-oxide reductase MsrA [bacterium]